MRLNLCEAEARGRGVSKLLVAMLIVLAGAAVGWWSAGWGSGERSKRGGGLWQ